MAIAAEAKGRGDKKGLQDSTCLELNVLVRVDDCGFFFYWSVEGKDATVLDLGNVWEVRVGSLPKDGRVVFELEQRGPPKETIEERTLWITHSQDLVNVNSFYLVADNVEQAKASGWLEAGGRCFSRGAGAD